MTFLLENYGMYVIFCILGILLIVRFVRGFVRGLMFSLVSGWGSLAFINLLSGITGIGLAVNFVTLGVSALLGIPGILTIFVLNLICG